METYLIIKSLLISLALFFVAEIIGDFLLQDRKTALSKSSSLWSLFNHGVDIFVPLLVTGILFNHKEIILIGIAYVFIHMIQDKFIWNLYKRIRKDKPKDFKYWEDKLFYDFIGIDRGFHVLAILFLYCAYYFAIYGANV